MQLFGGYGYMTEYPIARAYADARVTSIYGGTNEVMKTIIARPRNRIACPEALPLNQLAAPITPTVSETLATIGQ